MMEMKKKRDGSKRKQSPDGWNNKQNRKWKVEAKDGKKAEKIYDMIVLIVQLILLLKPSFYPFLAIS